MVPAEAVTILTVLGIWDTSIAQALADETSKRRAECLLWEESHGKPWREKKAEEFEQARKARVEMDSLAKQAYAIVDNEQGGKRRMMDYLAQPMLCSHCLNVRDSLAPCRNRCGRQLCGSCRTSLGICTNTGTCKQGSTVKWRVGIKLLNQDSELYKQWRIAAVHADWWTDHTGWGHRLAARSVTKLAASLFTCQQQMMQH